MASADDELRVAIALDHLGARLFGAQPEPGADELLHARVDGRVRADDAADRPDAHRLPGAPQTFAVAIQLERHDRELVPEAGRLGVDAVRPPDHHGVAVPQREAFHDAEQRLQPLEQQVGGRAQLQRQPGVQHVGRRHPEVDPAPLRPDRVGHHLDERGDVVARDRFDLEHPFDGERRRVRGSPVRPAAGIFPSSDHASTARTSISSQFARRASSDQTAAISGRLYRGIKA